MKVYLSSTLTDLIPEREAVKQALGGECTVVESYVADERGVRDSCLADVAGCDLYIGIVGLRYGFVLPGETCSITELEYRKAQAGSVPTLLFVKDEDEIKPRFHDAVTNENPRERIEKFRKEVSSGTDAVARAALFKSPEDLKAHVLKAYLRYSKRQEEPKPKPIEGRPYPGLRAFLPTEADRFFGRDAEVESLRERLLARGDRFLALIGASGSGKSSLVYAGLIPKLTTGALVGGMRWLAVSFSPRQLGEDPFVALAAALAARFPDARWPAAELAQRLRERPADIAPVAQEALGHAGTDAQLLLFVDQFEELFATKVDDGARTAFFALLAEAVACPLLRVVAAMRSDFYDRWPQDEASVALLRAGHFPVAVPGAAALEKMIVGPARAAGLSFEPPSLAQRILSDIGTAPGALALAEFALAQLYDRRQGHALTTAAYGAIGGVAGAIEGQAQTAVKRAEDELRRTGGALDDEAWSRLFMAIASVEDKGQEQAVARRRCTADELPSAALTLVQHLVSERLLVSSGAGNEPAVYEVGHEAVFSHWQRFQAWYGDHAEHLAVHRQAERAATDWAKAGRSPILRWSWERQKPALQALRQLEHLAQPAHDPDYADAMVALWRMLEARLSNSALKGFLHPEPLALLDELKSDATTHQRREEIGLRLAQMGDPRRGVGLDEAGLPEIDWVDVPAGQVTLEVEDTEAEAKNRAAFAVKPFKLARYPVTWAQYRAFLDADDGYRNPQWWEGRPREDHAGGFQWAFANHPAVSVSWYDAMAFCGWLRARLGMDDIRLPTEWEWQWAAVGGNDQEFPWPSEWNGARANTYEAGIRRTIAVGVYPLGRSPFRIDDMAGNVWEWCLNAYEDPPAISIEWTASRVLRGGAWLGGPGDARAASRDRGGPDDRSSGVGLRVCRGSPIE